MESGLFNLSLSGICSLILFPAYQTYPKYSVVLTDGATVLMLLPITFMVSLACLTTTSAGSETNHWTPITSWISMAKHNNKDW